MQSFAAHIAKPFNHAINYICGLIPDQSILITYYPSYEQESASDDPRWLGRR